MMKSTIALLLSLLSISSLAQSTAESTVYIPVVVHVAYSGNPNENSPTEQQIISKIAELNSVFNGTASFLGDSRDIGIQFRLATLSPKCTSTNGIDPLNYLTDVQYKTSGVQFKTRIGISEVELKMNTRWETSQYLNIWIVNKIDGVNSGAYSWLPNEAGGKDGIVITINDFNSNIASFVNVVGRFFNLYDLWELSGFPGYSVYCGDDEVADTDFVEEYSGPTRTGINPCSGLLYFRNTENNFMSHNLDRNLFTGGQKIRMRNALQLPNRKSLVNSITDEISSCLFNNSNTAAFIHNNSPVNSFKTLGIGKGGYIYAGTANQGLYKFNGKVWSKLGILTNDNGSNNINDIKTDKNGGIWIAQYGHTTTQAITGGVNYLPDSTETGHIYYPPSTSGLPTRNCRALFIDTTATQSNPRIWTANFAHITAGTSTTGAVGLGINSSLPLFTSITSGIDVSTQTASVQTIGGDENEVWAFVSGNFGKNQILSYNSQTAAFKKAYSNTDIGFSLASNFLVRSIYFDAVAKKKFAVDRRWVGISNGGVLVYQKNINAPEGFWAYVNATTHPTKFPSGSFINTNSITSDESGFIYFGTNQGLVVFTGGEVADSSNYQRFTTAHGLPSNNVLDIVDATHLGRIVIATDQGIVFWSKEFLKKRSGKFVIPPLIGQADYTVPREATIHHYFTVKNTSDVPIQGAYIAYKISNTGDTLVSNPSDDKGLIDLNFPVGGGDVTTSSDDFITAGSNPVIVSFVGAYDKNLDLIEIGGTSGSLNNASTQSSNAFVPFSISVIDKAPKINEEFGMSAKDELEFSIKTPDLQLPGVKAKIGGSSVGFGITSNPALIINPKSSNLWDVKVSTPLGTNAKAKVAANIKVSNEIEVGLGELKGKLVINSVGEYGYNIDLNSRHDCFFMGSKTLLLFAPNPFSFLSQVYLERLSRFIINKSITSEKNGFNIGIEANGALGLTSFKLFTPKSKQNKNEVGNGVFNLSARLDVNINVESNDEFLASDGTFTSTKRITALKENNVTVDIGAGGGADKMVNQIKFTPFKWASNSEKFQVSLKKNTDEFPYNARKTNYGIVEFSTEELKTIDGSEYKITNINNFKYSGRVLQKLESNPILTATNAPYSNLVLEKSVSPVLSLASNILTDGTNIYKQIFDFNDMVFQNFDATWNKNDVIISNKRKITKVSNYEVELEIPITPTYSLKRVIGYKFWNSYQHSGREYSNLQDLNSLLVTTDYPDIESNLELPSSNPLIYFWSKLSEGLLNSTPEEKQYGGQFITSKEETISSTPITLSNNTPQGQITRLSLDAKPIEYSNNKNSAATSATPSVFTFTIPASNQAFNTGTNIKFLYYYPENQLYAKTVIDTFKIITDTFFLDATDGANKLNTAPNGNFTINTQFSNYELELAGLPNNLLPRVLFLPSGSELWEDIGAANQTINFNRLGVFAIGIGLQDDYEPPVISVTAPPTFTNNDVFTVNLTDNLSGIDWSKTAFICNDTLVPIIRNGTSNTFSISIADIPKNSNNTFNLSIYTSDLAFHKQEFHHIYPCASSISFVNIAGSSFTPVNKHQALETIEVSGSTVIPPSIELKAGKSVLLSPGFDSENSGGYFKAEIGGCNTSGVPAQPANFTASTATVCKGQTGVVYTVPAVSGVTYNWSYSGTGATINGTDNSITINFAANATAGTLSVTAANGAGTSPALTVAINVNTPASPPNASGVTISSGSTASLTATGCTTYKWYSQPALGTAIHTGQNFTTPTLSSTTTYYVACNNGTSCESSRVPVVVTVQ